MAVSLTTVFGALGIADDEYSYPLTFGQEPIYDALMALLGNHNADLAAAEALFVEKDTEAHTKRYYLSTGGRMSKVTNYTKPEDTKAQGEWNVGFPLEEFGLRLARSRVQMAYMNAAMFGRHIQSILNADINTRRFNMLTAFFDNAPPAFRDENWGDITLYPLANSDGTYYPPVVGEEKNADSQHYLTATYDTSAIDDTHEPITAQVDLLEGHFGIPTGGSNIVTFINKTEVTAVQSLSQFNPIEYRFQDLGDNITEADSYPSDLPGRVLGEFGGKSLIVRWDWVPSKYFLSIHRDAPAPLQRRIDPASTGLAPGLQLLSQNQDEPFRDALWSNRYGYAVANRLNGVVTQINRSGSYQVPTKYTKP